MKKSIYTLVMFAVIGGFCVSTGCQPNGDENSTDTEILPQETTMDTTRYPGMGDSVGAGATIDSMR